MSSYKVTTCPNIMCVSENEINQSYTHIVVPMDIDYTQNISSRISGLTLLSEEQRKSFVSYLQLNEFKGEGGATISMTFDIKGLLTKFTVIGVSPSQEDLKNSRSRYFNNLQKIGAQAATLVIKDKKVLILNNFFSTVDECNADEASIYIAFGMAQKLYCFAKYFTTEKSKGKMPKVEDIAILSNNQQACSYIPEIAHQLDSIYLLRDLVNEPANVLYPEAYANIIKEQFKDLPVKVTIVGEEELKRMGMNMFVGVGLGSDKETKMVIMEYKGVKQRPEIDLALVGKGVTFDTGGISIKPAKGMDEMKTDMAGSALVVSEIKLLAARGASVNAVGLVGLVEN